MRETRKKLIDALQELLDECTDRLPHAEGWEYDFQRGRYSAIIDMADKVKEICDTKTQDNERRD